MPKFGSLGIVSQLDVHAREIDGFTWNSKRGIFQAPLSGDLTWNQVVVLSMTYECPTSGVATFQECINCRRYVQSTICSGLLVQPQHLVFNLSANPWRYLSLSTKDPIETRRGSQSLKQDVCTFAASQPLPQRTSCDRLEEFRYLLFSPLDSVRVVLHLFARCRCQVAKRSLDIRMTS